MLGLTFAAAGWIVALLGALSGQHAAIFVLIVALALAVLP
jgi:hypothetical protein